MQRTCTECKQVKPLEDFGVGSKRSLHGKRHQCKSCLAARQKAKYSYSAQTRYRSIKYKNNPRFKIEYNLRSEFGMSWDDYESLLEHQGGVCAICGSTDPLSRRGHSGENRFHVDHCHTTGVVRGLLCSNCNNGLGRFKDSTELLYRAAKYILMANTKFTHRKTKTPPE